MDCKSGIRMPQSQFKFGASEVTFEGYVQFTEYISFVKAMDSLRNMKLVHVDDDAKAVAANIKVDFDKTKHLSDKNIRKRRIENEKIQEEERIFLEEKKRIEEEEKLRLEAQRSKEEAERMKFEGEKMGRRIKREEKRRVKHMEKKRLVEQREIEFKIKTEERKLLIAERKLQSMRLLNELLKRAKTIKQAEKVERHERELEQMTVRENKERQLLDREETKRRGKCLAQKEKQLRNRVMESRNIPKTKKHKRKEENCQVAQPKMKKRKKRKYESISSDEASSDAKICESTNMETLSKVEGPKSSPRLETCTSPEATPPPVIARINRNNSEDITNEGIQRISSPEIEKPPVIARVHRINKDVKHNEVQSDDEPEIVRPPVIARVDRTQRAAAGKSPESSDNRDIRSHRRISAPSPQRPNMVVLANQTNISSRVVNNATNRTLKYVAPRNIQIRRTAEVSNSDVMVFDDEDIDETEISQSNQFYVTI